MHTRIDTSQVTPITPHYDPWENPNWANEYQQTHNTQPPEALWVNHETQLSIGVQPNHTIQIWKDGNPIPTPPLETLETLAHLIISAVNTTRLAQQLDRRNQ